MIYNEGFFTGTVEIEDEKLRSILERLNKAERELWDCYYELRDLGVVKIKKSPASEDGADAETIVAQGSGKD